MANNNRGSNTTKPNNRSQQPGNRNAGPVVSKPTPTPPVNPNPAPIPPSNNGERKLTPKQIAMVKRQRDRRRNQLVIGSLVVLTVVIAGILLYSFANTPQTISTIPTPVAIQHSGFVLGDSNAKVTLTEWGDFRCSACNSFYNDVEPTIINNYVKTGKIKFEFKNFITIDPQGTIGDSHEAAEAGWCAADQNRFWDFYNTMYQNYPGETPGFWTANRLKTVASDLKLNITQFNSCLDNHQHQQDVAQQQQQVTQNGFTGTPTLVINGTEFTGNFDSVAEVTGQLDRVLAQASGSTTPGASATTTTAATTTQAATTTTGK